MTVIERRVRELRIRAPDEDRARGAAIVLEDALRTATMPGASARGGQLIIIRRLDLGRVSRAAAPATVALAVEAAVHRVAAGAVHGESSRAEHAAAVYFDDHGEALLAMARRLASGRSMHEWFWPLVLGGWSVSAPRAATASLLLERAFTTAAGPLTASRIVESLAELDAIDPLLETLSEHDGAALLAASGLSGLDAGPSPTLLLAPQLPPPTRRVAARWLARWGGRATDRRAQWLVAMLLIADRPARASSSALPAIVREVLTSIAQDGAVGDERVSTVARPPETPPHGERDAADAAIPRDVKWWEWMRMTRAGSDVGGGRPAPDSRADSTSGSTPRVGAPAAPAPAESLESLDVIAPPHEPHWHAPRATAYAGLLFLIPLLSRIDIAALLAERPHLAEHDWHEHFMRRIATRLGVPDGDAVLAWLGADSAIRFEDRAITAATMRAVRNRCRLDTGRRLITVVRRPGVIVVTRTHIDLLMHHSQVDVAVRRAGLDIDPGWLPWLGRVVQFHYVDELPDVTA